MTTLTIEELEQAGERELGTSSWHEITQEQINMFAEATGDHQWIHVDPERAGASPFGGTVAHGFLTLSLAVALLDQTLVVDGCSTVINYGLNRVRFPTIVPVGSEIRIHVELAGVEEQRDSSLQATYALTFEVEGADKPGCVAESLLRYYP